METPACIRSIHTRASKWAFSLVMVVLILSAMLLSGCHSEPKVDPAAGQNNAATTAAAVQKEVETSEKKQAQPQ